MACSYDVLVSYFQKFDILNVGTRTMKFGAFEILEIESLQSERPRWDNCQIGKFQIESFQFGNIQVENLQIRNLKT